MFQFPQVLAPSQQEWLLTSILQACHSGGFRVVLLNLQARSLLSFVYNWFQMKSPSELFFFLKKKIYASTLSHKSDGNFTLMMFKASESFWTQAAFPEWPGALANPLGEQSTLQADQQFVRRVGVMLLLPSRCQREQTLHSEEFALRAPAASASVKGAWGAQPSPYFERFAGPTSQGESCTWRWMLKQLNAFVEEDCDINPISISWHLRPDVGGLGLNPAVDCVPLEI